MWFIKSLTTLCMCFLVTACGFRPLYVPVQEENRVAVPIKIATIQDRDGQILRNYLVDLLTPEGCTQKPLYILETSLTIVTTDIGVNKDETTSRKNATATAIFSLRDAATYQLVYTHSTRAINSFSIISQNYFSDLTTEEFAKREALRLLAEKISLLIVTFFDNTRCANICVPVPAPQPIVQESPHDEFVQDYLKNMRDSYKGH